MNNYLLSVLVFLISLFAIALTWQHYIYTGDTIADYTGYFISLVVLPVAWTVVPAGVLVTIKYHVLTKNQKWVLLAVPLAIQLFLIGTIFWALHYGEH